MVYGPPLYLISSFPPFQPSFFIDCTSTLSPTLSLVFVECFASYCCFWWACAFCILLSAFSCNFFCRSNICWILDWGWYALVILCLNPVIYKLIAKLSTLVRLYSRGQPCQRIILERIAATCICWMYTSINSSIGMNILYRRWSNFRKMWLPW